MTDTELAHEYVRDLFSDAGLVKACADDARHALASGNVTRAQEALRSAQRVAGLIEGRLDDALRILARAAATETP